jgi:hypothetical protein
MTKHDRNRDSSKKTPASQYFKPQSLNHGLNKPNKNFDLSDAKLNQYIDLLKQERKKNNT